MAPEIKQPKKRALKRCGHCMERVPAHKLMVGGEEDYPWELCPKCVAKYVFHCTDCGKAMAGDGKKRAIHSAVKVQYDGQEHRCIECAERHEENTPPHPHYRCRACNSWFRGESEHELCERHAKEYTTCDCGCLISRQGNNISVWVKGKKQRILVKMCMNCLQVLYPKCISCGSRHQINEQFPDLCDTCGALPLASCAECGKKYPQGTGIRTEEGDVCRGCYGEGGGDCRCGGGRRVLRYGQKYHHHHHGEYNKHGCVKCIGAPVMSWRYHRVPKFQGNGPLYFGFENEYDWKEDEFRKMTDRLRKWAGERQDLYHLVHDGSLRYGVEIVSQPGSYDFWMNKKNLLPDNVVNRLDMISKRTNQPGTAACHIHMSKDAFKVYHLYKFVKFLSDNFESFLPVFGRGLTDYCRDIKVDYRDFCKVGDNDKYSWINLKPEHTVEVRIFQAAKGEEDMRMYIQFLKAVYEYTKSRVPKRMTYDGFMGTLDAYPLVAERLRQGVELNVEVPTKEPRKRKNGKKPARRGINIPDPMPMPDPFEDILVQAIEEI